MNKKLLILLSTFIFLSFCFSQSYRISDTEFDIKGVGFSFLGKTKPYSVKTKYPLDTKKVFPTEDDLHLFGDVTGKKMLEICCGSGHSLKYNAEKGVGELWGVDLSQKQLDNAAKLLKDNGYVIYKPI